MESWEARTGEPVEAYERFIEYCMLGPGRTLDALWLQSAAPTSRSHQPPAAWREIAARFDWESRSAAWDAASVAHEPEIERLGTVAERRIRLRFIRRGLMLGLRLLDSASLDALDAEQARALAPMARQLIKDMLAAHRAESAAPLAASERHTLHLTADDFAAAEREARLNLGIPYPSGWTPDATVRESDTNPPAAPNLHAAPRLLVCIGDDPALEVDLAMLRGVRARTGLAFHALHRVTRGALARSLRRARGVGRPVRYLHLACHASAAGVEFADGLVDGAWLSARLEGVEVLLIAACRGDEVGDWLRVVPYVVTFDDDLPHSEAANVAFAFWGAIAAGLGAEDALETALAHCSPDVSESVVRHW